MTDEQRTSLRSTVKPKCAPGALYMLFDSDGEHFDTCETRDDAKGMAWGPRFERGFTIVCYKKETTRRTPK